MEEKLGARTPRRSLSRMQLEKFRGGIAISRLIDLFFSCTLIPITGQLICSNIVLFSWIFFFVFLVNNGLLFLSDLELVVIILDLFFIRSFYCLVCCVGRGAQLYF